MEEQRLAMMVGETINIDVNNTLVYNGRLDHGLYQFQLNTQYHPNRTILINSDYSGLKKDTTVKAHDNLSLTFRDFKLYRDGGNIEFTLIFN